MISTMTTPKRKPGRPRREDGYDPVVCVRVPIGRRDAARASAEANGTDLTTLINAYLAWLTREPGHKPLKRPSTE